MKVAFTALFSTADLSPGVFNLLEQLVWAGWNTVWDRRHEQNNQTPVRSRKGGLRPLPSEPCSGSSLVWILSAPIRGSIGFTCNFLCWLLGEKLVVCGYQNERQGTNMELSQTLMPSVNLCLIRACCCLQYLLLTAVGFLRNAYTIKLFSVCCLIMQSHVPWARVYWCTRQLLISRCSII